MYGATNCSADGCATMRNAMCNSYLAVMRVRRGEAPVLNREKKKSFPFEMNDKM